MMNLLRNKKTPFIFILLSGGWAWFLFIITALYPLRLLSQNPVIHILLVLSLALIIELGLASIPVVLMGILITLFTKKEKSGYWIMLLGTVILVIIPLVWKGPVVRDSLRLIGFRNHLPQYQKTLDDYRGRIETNTLNWDQQVVPGRSKDYYIKGLSSFYPADPVRIRYYGEGNYLIFFETGGVFPFTRGGYVYYSSEEAKKESAFLQKTKDIKNHWVMYSH